MCLGILLVMFLLLNFLGLCLQFSPNFEKKIFTFLQKSFSTSSSSFLFLSFMAINYLYIRLLEVLPQLIYTLVIFSIIFLSVFHLEYVYGYTYYYLLNFSSTVSNLLLIFLIVLFHLGCIFHL